MDVNGLFYVCELAGVALIAAAIWLLYKHVISLDSEERSKLTYQRFALQTSPAIFLFVIAAGLILFPVHVLRDVATYTPYVRVEQDITSKNLPIDLYLVVHDQNLRSEGKVVIMVPLIKANDYAPEIMYWPCGYPNPLPQSIPLERAQGGVIKLDRRDFTTLEPCRYGDSRPGR
jgi:hypothetical protein